MTLLICMPVTIIISAMTAFASEANGKSLLMLSCPGSGGKSGSHYGGSSRGLCSVPFGPHWHVLTWAKAGGKYEMSFRQHLKAAERGQSLSLHPEGDAGLLLPEDPQQACSHKSRLLLLKDKHVVGVCLHSMRHDVALLCTKSRAKQQHCKGERGEISFWPCALDDKYTISAIIWMQTSKAIAASAPGWEGDREGTELMWVGWTECQA